MVKPFLSVLDDTLIIESERKKFNHNFEKKLILRDKRLRNGNG